MNVAYSTIRSAVFDYLRTAFPEGRKRRGVDLQFSYLLNHLKNKDIQPESQRDEDVDAFEGTLSAVIHDLYLERIIVTGTGSTNATGDTAMSWPWFRLTQHGQSVIADETSPYDPNRYLEQLRSKVAGINEQVLCYITEALTCLRNDCILAAAVMVGCASEKAILILIDVFGNQIADEKKRNKYQKDTDKRNILARFSAFRDKWLSTVSSQLPQELKHSLGRNLDGIFHLIRETRNAAGHPHGTSIERNDVAANLILFVGYLRFVSELTEFFRNNPPEV
jgi:hypothetical protein